DRVDHPSERVLLTPDFDIRIGIVSPECFPVKARGFAEGIGDAVECLRLALPTGIIGKPAIGHGTAAAQQHEIGFDLGVTRLGFFDEALDGGCIENLPHRCWPLVGREGDEPFAALGGFVFGRPAPFYRPRLINRERAHWPPSSSSRSMASRAARRKRSRTALS